MILNVWLVGLAISLVVLKVDDYCEGRQRWRDFLVSLIAALFWPITFPWALVKLWRDIRVEKAKEGDS